MRQTNVRGRHKWRQDTVRRHSHHVWENSPLLLRDVRTKNSKYGGEMKITACPFDGSKKLRQVGVDNSNAQECTECHHIFVLRPREENGFAQWHIYVYDSVMHAASEQPLEFQTSMF
jgi:hypothetical protein